MNELPKKMMNLYVDADIVAWLNHKSSEGYNRSSLIRRILHKQMDREGYVWPKPAAAKYHKPVREKEQKQPDPGLDKITEGVFWYLEHPEEIENIEAKHVKSLMLTIKKGVDERLADGSYEPKAREVNKSQVKGSQKGDVATTSLKYGLRYEDVETPYAVIAWSYDHPGEPLPEWLEKNRIKYLVDQYNKSHKY
jgi:hypothetical protein